MTSLDSASSGIYDVMVCVFRDLWHHDISSGVYDVMTYLQQFMMSWHISRDLWRHGYSSGIYDVMTSLDGHWYILTSEIMWLYVSQSGLDSGYLLCKWDVDIWCKYICICFSIVFIRFLCQFRRDLFYLLDYVTRWSEKKILKIKFREKLIQRFSREKYSRLCLIRPHQNTNFCKN